MIGFLCILQWVLALAVVAFAFRYSYRAGRLTWFGVCFTWGALMLLALAAVLYTLSWGRGQREQWGNSFLEGPHVLAFAAFGWIQGLLVAALAVGTRRVIRREPLFPFLHVGHQHQTTDAQRAAPPNGGPAERLGSSGAGGGPPSVS